MKQLLTALTGTAALAVSAPAMAHNEGDEVFEELVEGRVAGEPQQCISTFHTNRLRVVEHVGLVYERGDTLWVARTRSPRQLGHWDVPVIERYGSSRLCTHDVRRTVDRSGGYFSGVLSLEDFVPYRRPENG
jgi:hypothetical protein